ncbi:MAG: hypothetical protein ABIR80_11835, partial [Opitutaceae bacterium]
APRRQLVCKRRPPRPSPSPPETGCARRTAELRATQRTLLLPHPFMPIPASIQKRVETFGRNLDSYLKPEYKEAPPEKE